MIEIPLDDVDDLMTMLSVSCFFEVVRQFGRDCKAMEYGVMTCTCTRNDLVLTLVFLQPKKEWNWRAKCEDSISKMRYDRMSYGLPLKIKYAEATGASSKKSSIKFTVLRTF